MAIPDPRSGLIDIKPHMVSMNVDTQPTTKINISSNESVLGPSTAVRTAALEAVSCMERYAESADSTVDPIDRGMKWLIDSRKSDFIGKRAMEIRRRNQQIRPELVGLLPKNPN